MEYYKATRRDGTDFRTGTIDYSPALNEDGTEFDIVKAAEIAKAYEAERPMTFRDQLADALCPPLCRGHESPCPRRAEHLRRADGLLAGLDVARLLRVEAAAREMLDSWANPEPGGSWGNEHRFRMAVDALRAALDPTAAGEER